VPGRSHHIYGYLCPASTTYTVGITSFTKTFVTSIFFPYTSLVPSPSWYPRQQWSSLRCLLLLQHVISTPTTSPSPISGNDKGPSRRTATTIGPMRVECPQLQPSLEHFQLTSLRSILRLAHAERQYVNSYQTSYMSRRPAHLFSQL